MSRAVRWPHWRVPSTFGTVVEIKAHGCSVLARTAPRAQARPPSDDKSVRSRRSFISSPSHVRATASLKCEAVPRRARIQGSSTCVSLDPRRVSNDDEEEAPRHRAALWRLRTGTNRKRPKRAAHIHPGVELSANLKSISHRCNLEEAVFVWELTKTKSICPWVARAWTKRKWRAPRTGVPRS